MTDGIIYTYGVKVYNAYKDVYDGSDPGTCEELGFNLGKILSELLDFKIEDTVYFSEVYKYGSWATCALS